MDSIQELYLVLRNEYMVTKAVLLVSGVLLICVICWVIDFRKQKKNKGKFFDK